MNDSEAKATYRYMLGGFGKLGTKLAYKRYATYVDWLNGKKKINRRKWVGYVFIPEYTPAPSPDKASK